jgi:hypothetical protein
MKWILCLIFGHLPHWKRGLPESASPGEYYQCCWCGHDTREWWEIEDDTMCRIERLELRLRGKQSDALQSEVGAHQLD